MSAKLMPGWVVRRMTNEEYIAAGCGEPPPRRSGIAHERGVVTWAEGCNNRMSHGGPLAPVKGEAVIRVSAGHHIYTTYTDEWIQIPEGEWTALERVWSAHVTWYPPDWYDEGDRVADYDTWEWWLMRALLPPHHMARVFPEESGDHPTDWLEFAVAVAQCHDFDAAAAAATFS